MRTLVEYALTFVGKPYRWGGDDAIEGYDCSGLVQELLFSAGAHPNPKVDHTAQMLFDYFSQRSTWNSLTVGALAFYGQSTTRIIHVAMLIDPYRIIEAGGGGSKTTTLEAAVAQNAFVRIRPIRYRSDLVAIVKPGYPLIGVP